MIQENIEYLKDTARFPKQTKTIGVFPKYEIRSEEYNKIVEAISEINDSVVADRLKDVQFFEGFLDSVTPEQVSFGEMEAENVYFVRSLNTFCAEKAGSIGTIGQEKYSKNWSNRELWTSVNLIPYDYKAYISLEDKKIYAFIDNVFEMVGGVDITIDNALSSTSENPVQNKVVSGALSSIETNVATNTTTIVNLQSSVNDILLQLEALGKKPCRTVFFAEIKANTNAVDASRADEADFSDVYFDETLNTFVAFKQNGLSMEGAYYKNWPNKSEWMDDEFKPYEDVLYVDVDGEKCYIYKDDALVSVGGGNITVDEELSETSENPLQNKVVTQELLKRKKTIFFNGVKSDDDEIEASESISADVEPENVYRAYVDNTWMFVAYDETTKKYYKSWTNKSEWTDENGKPYEDAIYIDLNGGAYYYRDECMNPIGVTKFGDATGDIKLRNEDYLYLGEVNFSISSATNTLMGLVHGYSRNYIIFFDGFKDNINAKDTKCKFPSRVFRPNVYYDNTLKNFVCKAVDDSYYKDWDEKYLYGDKTSPHGYVFFYCEADKKLYSYDSTSKTLVNANITIPVDQELDETSENPVANKAVCEGLEKRQKAIRFDYYSNDGTVETLLDYLDKEVDFWHVYYFNIYGKFYVFDEETNSWYKSWKNITDFCNSDGSPYSEGIYFDNPSMTFYKGSRTYGLLKFVIENSKNNIVNQKGNLIIEKGTICRSESNCNNAIILGGVSNEQSGDIYAHWYETDGKFTFHRYYKAEGSETPDYDQEVLIVHNTGLYVYGNDIYLGNKKAHIWYDETNDVLCANKSIVSTGFVGENYDKESGHSAIAKLNKIKTSLSSITATSSVSDIAAALVAIKNSL